MVHGGEARGALSKRGDEGTCGKDPKWKTQEARQGSERLVIQRGAMSGRGSSNYFYKQRLFFPNCLYEYLFDVTYNLSFHEQQDFINWKPDVFDTMLHL